MARPKADLPSAADIEALFDAERRLAVRVTPGARSEGMAIEQGRLLVRTRAKPQDGAANVAVIKLVAKALGLAPSRVEMLHGATSREKLLRVSE